jgi:putative FmdB family regulatory protein
MPTYEYACRSCGDHLEIVQSFKDEPITECPACGGSLRKVFGSVGIVFKGSGFYKNDSRSSSKVGANAPAASSSGGDTKSSTSVSPDSAPSPSSGESSPASKPSSDGKASSDGKSSSDAKPKSPAAASA